MKRALTQLYSSAPANLHGNTLASASFSKSSRSTTISTPKVQPQVARNGVAQPMPIPQHSMSRTLGVAATQEQQMRQQLLPTPQSLKNLCNIGETPPTSATEDQQRRKQTATKANRADLLPTSQPGHGLARALTIGITSLRALLKSPSPLCEALSNPQLSCPLEASA